MDFEIGEKVQIVIGRFTKIGITVLVEDEFEGMLFRNEVFQKVREGQRMEAYVKSIRDDGKLDLSLQPTGFLNKIDTNQQTVLDKLHQENGFLALNDKSDPESIKYHLKMSKKSFKSAIGGLYKAKKIIIGTDGIRLPS